MKTDKFFYDAHIHSNMNIVMYKENSSLTDLQDDFIVWIKLAFLREIRRVFPVKPSFLG